jgi:hypothetical protein
LKSKILSNLCLFLKFVTFVKYKYFSNLKVFKSVFNSEGFQNLNNFQNLCFYLPNLTLKFRRKLSNITIFKKIIENWTTYFVTALAFHHDKWKKEKTTTIEMWANGLESRPIKKTLHASLLHKRCSECSICINVNRMDNFCIKSVSTFLSWWSFFFLLLALPTML